MEIVQGKPKDKKVVIAQEIAFAKVLAGNNKTLRDRAVKKLRKWLTVRGNGEWQFTEDEFLRIWTGLFYCMWMSDKFLVQEELAESISNLIHCFKKNSATALLFIKCFNKRILIDWEGLDQYRIDKFNMLVRRFLRQTFVHCKEKDWEESFLHKLMDIFYNVVLHRDNSLGFVMHFISIYAEELAKVSKGKLETKTVLMLIEPFVKLISRTKDIRIQREAEGFFDYLMRQTDTGIEFEEKFNAWKEQGFPGEGPDCMGNVDDELLENGKEGLSEEDGEEDDDDDDDEGEDEDFNNEDGPLDPRAGSVHVVLPQIPIDVNAILNLFKKHQNSKHVSAKGKRILKNLSQKLEALNKGKFPEKIEKDPILTESKKKKQSRKTALKLLEFTRKIDEEPIKTAEFKHMSKELEEQDEEDKELNEENEVESENEDVNIDDEINYPLYETMLKLKTKNKTKKINPKKQKDKLKNNTKANEKTLKKVKISKETSKNEITENGNHKENLEQSFKKKKRKNRKRKQKNLNKVNGNEEILVTPKKKQKLNKEIGQTPEKLNQDPTNVTPVNKTGTKRKILSSWQVQELDTSSPEYYKLETPKIIRIEKKINGSFCHHENESEKPEEAECKTDETPKAEILPVFWERAKAKAAKKTGSKNKVFVNPFADVSAQCKSPGRRISFALEKNMAQENEEYLEEVKNSPRVPFDGSKKPVQSALKSGLAPSPVNPFYRFKKIKI